MKNIVFNYLFALVVALALAGCNSDSSSSGADDVASPTPTTQPQSPTPSETDPETDPPMQSADPLVPVAGEGYAQKGPYQTGATVTVQELDSEGSLTGQTWSTQTDSDGKIRFEGIGWQGLAMVTVNGHYFNEYSGAYTPEPFRLRAVMYVSDETLVGNVNLFTHLIARYMEYWLPEGYTYEELRGWANDYIMTWFGLMTPPENLNLLDSIDPETDRDSYMLLLYSAAMAKAGLTQADVDALAEDFAVTDAGWADEWPEGPGKQALMKMFNEAQNNEAALIEQARKALQQEFGRVFQATESGANRVAGTICVYAGVLCPWGDLTNIPISPEPRDIPVSVPYSGSYGFLMNLNDNGSGATARFGRAPGDNSIRSVSGSVSDFLEFMIQPIEGDRRYNLGLSSTTNKTVTSVRMFQLSQGIKKDPYPLVVGDNAGLVGIEWGTFRNTDSYYQLIAGPGRYRFTIGGYTCGTSTAPVVVRGYQWDWDIREPLPEDQAGRTPFDTASTAQPSENQCSHQIELINDTHPNRLYLHVEAIGIRDRNINANRAISEDFTIRVERL